MANKGATWRKIGQAYRREGWQVEVPRGSKNAWISPCGKATIFTARTPSGGDNGNAIKQHLSLVRRHIASCGTCHDVTA